MEPRTTLASRPGRCRPGSARSPSARTLAAAILAVALALGGCGGDDDGSAIDAPAIDSGIDAAACILSPTVVSCTDDTPCTAVCGNAYCYNFMQVGQVCTTPCTDVGDCPAGWSCNNMGRCRPP